MSASVRSLWVTFKPVALSLPPGIWMPGAPPCNSTLLCSAPGIGCLVPFVDSAYLGENFCPFDARPGIVGSGDDFVDFWDTRYFGTDDNGYGYDAFFYDTDVEDWGLPRQWALGQGTDYNGGHKYIESIYLAGYDYTGAQKAWYIDVWQNFGPQPNGTGQLAHDFWRDNAAAASFPSVYGPYTAESRIVVQYSNGFIMDEGGYCVLMDIAGLQARAGGIIHRVMLTCQTRDPSWTVLAPYNDDQQRLWLNFGGALNVGWNGFAIAPIPIHLGLASTLLFDGLPHDWHLIVERNGNLNGDVRVTVTRDGAVLYSGTIPFYGGGSPPDTMFFFERAEFMENIGPIKLAGTTLTADQFVRVYEIEQTSIGMPTVGP
jgi:hypothetical protein